MASKYALWGSSLALGGVLGYVAPPFQMIRSYIDYENSKYISEAGNKHHPALVNSYSQLLEFELMSLPLVKGLLNDPALTMRRAWSGPHYQTHPEEKPWRKGEVFTANTLHQPGGIAAKPVVFTNNEQKSATIVLHVGHKVTGFPAIVHGGVLATLLDEALGRTAFLSLPESTGVTANLKLKYKAPTFAHQFIVIKTETEKVDGRKAFVKGCVETLHGQKLVEANALFVVPKDYKLKKITN